MFLLALLILALVAAIAHGQEVFECADFNVTEALCAKGVDVSLVSGSDSNTERSFTASCSIACNALHVLFGDVLITQNDTGQYNNFTGSYWSQQQAQVDPQCIFKPSTSEQLSIQILISRLTKCPFTVKSGGHAAFAGASSIQGGITVSLQNFNEITVAADKKTAILTPGNTWYNVYTATENQDVVPIGGRVSAIGVGGLTLGGGISFFSGLHGWACDNIADYELVTANGKVIQVSLETYPDLYWALRGGGNNFGIVTKFRVYVYPLKGQLMWGGSRISPQSQFPALIQAFYSLGAVGAVKDPNAAQILSFAYAQGAQLADAELEYAQPLKNPPVFAEYLAVPAAIDTTGIKTLRNLTQGLAAANPDGRRETYWVVSFKLSLDMVTACKDIFYDELKAIEDAAGLVPAVTMQTITVPILQAMQVRGGNPLGLLPDDGPLLLANINVQWNDTADDARILQASHNMVKRMVEFAQSHGFANDYIYMNYASQFQDVISSYGAENKMKLQNIAKKYDPAGVFQTLMPGYFKLNGPPATWSG